jgi:hypothetical protein
MNFWRYLGPMLLWLFLLPAAAVALLHGSRRFQAAMVALIALLLIGDIDQLLSFEGGDRKGCETCYFLAMLHGLFGIVAVAAAVTYRAFPLIVALRARVAASMSPK